MFVLVIKIKKIHFLIFITIFLFVSLVFVINYEEKSETVSVCDTVKLPVIMYHHITENPKKAGTYTVTTSEFENDLKFIKSCGYTAVSVSEITDYVYSGKNLPEKPIMITFDDGFESYKVLAFELLKKYNMKSTVFIIGSTADLYSKIDDHHISYSNLNWEAISILARSPLCEIHSHTYDLHHNEKGERKGMSRLKNESDEKYFKNISDDLTILQKLFESHSLPLPTAIAYPFGAYDNKTKDIIKSLGFKVSFTCESGINTLTYGNKDCLYDLGRYNRKSGVSSENFFADILAT